jgi:predicted O-methyltransferase YrrM
MPSQNSLMTEPTRSTLRDLHAQARGDRLRFISLAPRILGGLVRGRKLFDVMTPESMKECFIPVSAEQGEFLYLTARAIGARTIVEFGTSFGISTIYLAAAVCDNGGGSVIGSEIEPSKHERALANLERAGVSDVVDVRLGDALETLREVPEPVDLVLLDGWKDLYLPVLELLAPRLRAGSVVLADNIFTFRKSLRPYVDHMQSGRHGFASTTLKISDGFEYSVCLTRTPEARS